ncbi:glycosyltransferase [Achromobacter sp. GG226]|uniref:glycosyltransferase n=1 Tax=Verticiella alkaliphila TaxID=2779529 RepID=UPI001C0C3405|nr:glycosyltransferase [Verticiella sp. GG226]MBU4609709.1 glycosyltransferase [Verticiella sp. GG226]
MINLNQRPPKRVCLVTQELPGVGPSGGIGTAFQELAIVLAENGYKVDVLYAGEASSPIPQIYAQNGISVNFVEFSAYTWSSTPLSRSYAIYQTLRNKVGQYFAIHFHEYGGLAFYALKAKKLLNLFRDTALIVQTHGPTRWALASNMSPIRHPDQLLIDYMEKRSVGEADLVVSPSQYLLDWMTENGFPKPRTATVIPNISTPVQTKGEHAREHREVKEIIFFGRHEFRKGISTFTEAVTKIREEIGEKKVIVTFLGQPSEINGSPSEIWLTERTRLWDFPIRLLTNMSRDDATQYIAERPSALVIVPSTQENSPYTVLENLVQGTPLITSSRGGAIELIPEELRESMTFDGSANDLAIKISSALTTGIQTSAPAMSVDSVRKRWLDAHTRVQKNPENISKSLQSKIQPKVVLGITHYERPQKLLQAVYSVLNQTYDNISIFVLDDGSSSNEANATLDRIQRIIAPYGGRVIRQSNKYLGAARNRIAKESASEYLIFLDDDDLALPSMVETLVTAAQNSPGSIIAPLNLSMEESRRGAALVHPEGFQQKVSHFVSGGPISTVPYANYLSSATALFPREVFDRLGGYSELQGVGFEDFELFARALQCRVPIEVIPEALYLYETDRPSMISSTPAMANLSRVLGVIDIQAFPSEWMDLLGCVGAEHIDESVKGRASWLEQVSPNRSELARIRHAEPNSEERFRALADYAHKIGAFRMSSAWKIANVTPKDKVAYALGVDFQNKQPQAEREMKIPARAYQPTAYSLSACFDSHATADVHWAISERKGATLIVSTVQNSTWLSLECIFDTADLLEQGVVEIDIDTSSASAFEGVSLLRRQRDTIMEDSELVAYSVQGEQKLSFTFRANRTVPDAAASSYRFIMFLPIRALSLTVFGVQCNVRAAPHSAASSLETSQSSFKQVA